MCGPRLFSWPEGSRRLLQALGRRASFIHPEGGVLADFSPGHSPALELRVPLLHQGLEPEQLLSDPSFGIAMELEDEGAQIVDICVDLEERLGRIGDELGRIVGELALSISRRAFWLVSSLSKMAWSCSSPPLVRILCILRYFSTRATSSSRIFF